MKVKSNRVGICPICNKESLEYECEAPGFLDPNFDYFTWVCKECYAQGCTYFELKFVGHSIINKDGKLIEIEDNMIESENEENEER